MPVRFKQFFSFGRLDGKFNLQHNYVNYDFEKCKKYSPVHEGYPACILKQNGC